MATLKSPTLYSFAGLQKSIKDNFGVKECYISQLENVGDILSKVNSYPISFLRIVSVKPNETGNNVRRMASRGTVIAKENAHEGTRLALVPVTIGLTMTYITPDFEGILDFISKWQFTAIRERLSFSLEYAGTNLDFSCMLTPDLTIPNKDEFSEEADNFKLEGEINFNTWVTNLDDGRDVQEIPLIRFTTSTLSVDGVLTSIIDKDLSA